MIRTQLLIRPNPEIPFLDTVYDGGFVALQVDNLSGLNIQSGDLVSVEQKDPSLNPQYDATHSVFYTTLSNNTITLATLWGQSGPVNPGVITNVTRGITGATYSVTFSAVDLDLKEDLQFPLNFNIADIRTPQNRKSNFSKNIELPGTNKNNAKLGHLYEIDVDSVFDVNLKHGAVVLQDGLEIFNGNMKMNSVKRDLYNDIVKYDVTMDGELSDIFSALKNPDGTDLMLSDLDLSEYVHALTRENVISTWTGTIQKGGTAYTNISETLLDTVVDTYFATGGRTCFGIGSTAISQIQVGDVVRFVMDNPGSTAVNFDASQGHHTVVGFDETFGYPIVNLAFQSGDVNSGTLYLTEATGEGYVYPTVSYGQGPGGSIANDDHYPPGLLVNWIPWIYAKTYLDKIFKKVGFSYESSFFQTQFFKRLVVSDCTTFPVNLLVNMGSPLSGVGFDSSIIPFDTIVFDASGAWSATDFWYTNVSTTFAPSFRIHLEGTFENPGQSIVTLTMWRSLNNDGTPNVTWPTGFGNLHNNAGDTNADLNAWDLVGYGGFGATVAVPGVGTTITGNSFVTDFTIDWVTLQPGEQVRFRVQYIDDVDPNGLIVSAGRLGEPRDKKDVDMSCKDFLVSLIGAFNLYVEPDRQRSQNLIIEPFEDYYDSTFLDWTSKVDISQDVQITPLSTSLAKVYKFSYDDDTDFLNTDYTTQYKKNYSEHNKVTSTSFTSSTIETRIKFASTPLFDNYSVTDVNPQTGEFIIPGIYKDIQRASVQRMKPRLLYYTGIRRTNALGGFRVTIGSIGIPADDTSFDYGISMYSYAGHLDNPLDATLDLNFGLPDSYYYGETYPFLVTANTLYERFYRRYVEELSNKRSRLVKFYMKLESTDINNLSFRKTYYIDGQYYRLQKINDYNPLTGKPVLCEFVKAQFNPTIDNNIVPEGCYPSGTEISGYLGTEADLDAICFGNGYVAGTNALIASGTYEGYRRTLVSGASAGSAVFSNVAPAVNEWVGVGTDYEAVLAGNGYFTVDGIGNTSAYQNVYLVMEAAGSSSGVTPVLLNQTPFSAPGGTGTAFYSILPPAAPVLDLGRQIQFYQSDSQNGDYTAVAGTIMSEQDLIDNPVELPFNVWYRVKYFTETCNYGYSRGYIPVG